ncbi:MAG: O-antigen ligase family protein [Burkholderiales bacterium]|nr:O-antigen ligase family protein [Burkholderiales bacterium]
MLGTTILFTLVLLFTVVAIGGLISTSNLAIRLRDRVASGLIFSAVIAGLLSSFFSNRVLTLGDDLVDPGGGGEAGGTLLSKLILAIVLAASCSALVGWVTWWKPRPLTGPATAAGSIAVQPDWQLITAFALFFVCYGLVPLAFAPDFHFKVSLVYPIFFFLAVLLYLPYSRVSPVRIVTDALLLICVSSLLAAVLRPDVSVLSGYRGLIPGFDFRLYGLTSHPNSLGYAASCLLVLAMADSSRSNPVRVGTLFVAAMTLLFSQSKTSIVACMAGTAVILIWWLWSGRIGATRFQRGFDRILIGRALLAFLVASLVAIAWFVLTDAQLRYSVLSSLDQREVGRLGTFTGRTAIWQFAIDSAKAYPWFGYGLGLWTDESRIRIGLLGASSAHNLVLEVLVRSGILGLVALVILLGVMIRGLVLSIKETSAASLALLVIFLVRGFFEVPVQVHGIIGSGVFAFLTLLVCSDRSVRAVPKDFGRPLSVGPARALDGSFPREPRSAGGVVSSRLV